jgi:hypothetical protein
MGKGESSPEARSVSLALIAAASVSTCTFWPLLELPVSRMEFPSIFGSRRTGRDVGVRDALQSIEVTVSSTDSRLKLANPPPACSTRSRRPSKELSDFSYDLQPCSGRSTPGSTNRWLLRSARRAVARSSGCSASRLDPPFSRTASRRTSLSSSRRGDVAVRHRRGRGNATPLANVVTLQGGRSRSRCPSRRGTKSWRRR